MCFCGCSPFSGVPPAMYKRGKVQCQGQVPVPSKLCRKVLPDAGSEWSPAAPSDFGFLQPDTGSLHAHAASDLQQRQDSR